MNEPAAIRQPSVAAGLPFPSPVPQFPCCKKRAAQLGATSWGGSGGEMLVAVQDRAGAVGLLDLSTLSTSDVPTGIPWRGFWQGQVPSGSEPAVQGSHGHCHGDAGHKGQRCPLPPLRF